MTFYCQFGVSKNQRWQENFCLLLVALQFSRLLLANKITISPRIQTAAQGEIVNFTCASNVMIRNLVLSIIPLRTAIPEIVHGNVIFDHSASFRFAAMKNSSVLCIDPKSGEQPDAGAFLYVQGLLDPVSQLHLVQGRLSWEPPFTLAGVSILGYEVTVNNTALMSTTTTNITTLDVEHFNLEHCHTYQFTVAALNSVGTGGNTSVVGTYTEANIFSDEFGNALLFSINETETLVTIPIFVKYRKHCDTTELPVSTCLKVQGNTTYFSCVQLVNNGSSISTNISSTTENSPIVFLVTYDANYETVVPANRKFQATLLLNSITTNSSINFSTHDVQTVKLLNSSCFRFAFMNNSQASGCYFNVTNDFGFNETFKVQRNKSSNTASGCVSVAVGGDYTLIVYDWESDGSVSTEPALIETITVIIIPTLSSTIGFHTSALVVKNVTVSPSVTIKKESVNQLSSLELLIISLIATAMALIVIIVAVSMLLILKLSKIRKNYSAYQLRRRTFEIESEPRYVSTISTQQKQEEEYMEIADSWLTSQHPVMNADGAHDNEL